MNRRTILAFAGSGGVSLLAGCWGGDGEGCPEPDLESELSFQVRVPDGETLHSGSGIELLTAQSQTDKLAADVLNRADEQWISETNFDEAVVVAVKEAVGGSQTSEFEILGVGVDSENTLHVYSCNAEVAGGDVARNYTRLLRVSHDGQQPTRADYTHWEQGDRFDYETNV